VIRLTYALAARDARRHGLLQPLSVVLALLLAGCGGGPQSLEWSSVDTLIADRFPETPSITTTELSKMLTEPSPPLLLIDARTPEEYDVSHLRGALNLESADAAAAWIAQQDGSAIVVAYCSVGYRSAALVTELRGRGITQAVNLEGSIFAWANEGRPVYQGDSQVDTVHPFDASWGALLDQRFWPDR